MRQVWYLLTSVPISHLLTTYLPCLDSPGTEGVLWNFAGPVDSSTRYVSDAALIIGITPAKLRHQWRSTAIQPSEPVRTQWRMVSLKINKSGSEYIGADFPSSMCGAMKVVINTNKSGQSGYREVGTCDQEHYTNIVRHQTVISRKALKQRWIEWVGQTFTVLASTSWWQLSG